MATKTKTQDGSTIATISPQLQAAMNGFSARHLNVGDEDRAIAVLYMSKRITDSELHCLVTQIVAHRGIDPEVLMDGIEKQKQEYLDRLLTSDI